MDALTKYRKKISQNMTDISFLMSSVFLRWLQNLAKGFVARTQGVAEVVRIHMIKDSEYVAFTSGDDVTLNVDPESNQMIKGLPREEAVRVLVGILTHELAHRWLTNFIFSASVYESMSKYGVLYPGPMDSGLSDVANDITEYCRNDRERRTSMTQIQHYIFNVLEDGRIEERCLQNNFGILSNGLQTARSVQWKSMNNIEELQQMIDNSQISEVGACLSALLQYAKYGVFKINDREELDSPFMRNLLPCLPYVDAYIVSTKAAVRSMNANAVLCLLWPLVKADIEKEEFLRELFLQMLSEYRETLGNKNSKKVEEEEKGENEPATTPPSKMEKRRKATTEAMKSLSKKAPEKTEPSKTGDHETSEEKKAGKDDESKSETRSSKENSEEQESESGEGASIEEEADSEDNMSGSGTGSSEADESEDQNDASGSGTESSEDDESDESESGEGASIEEETDGEDNMSGSGTGSSEDDAEEADSEMGETESEDGESSEEEADAEGEMFNTGSESSEEESNSDLVYLPETEGEAIDTYDGIVERVQREMIEDVEKDRKEACDEMLKLLSALVTEEAEKEMAADVVKDGDSFARQIPMPNIHKGVPIKVQRTVSVSQATKDAYNIIAPQVASIVNRTAGNLERILKDKKIGGKKTNLFFGRRLDARTLYRDDAKSFCTKKLPSGDPSTAFFVLVDESGSMGGERIESARLTSLVLDGVFCKLHVPYSIYGHTTYDRGRRQGVLLNAYADFGHNDANDKFRIMNMQANDFNRDGASLRFAMERLKERTENTKVLLLICDGQPAADGYSGKEAERDLQSIQLELARNGIRFIVTGIGGDEAKLKSIYGDSYMHVQRIDHLSTILPKKLIPFIQI